MERVLVTGGGGFIASHLSRQLFQQGSIDRRAEVQSMKNCVDVVKILTNDLSDDRDDSLRYPFKVSCVIPTLNEQTSIGEVIREVRKYVDEVIVVDGHSEDGTFETAVQEGVHVFLQRSKGKGAALREAFTRATGDVVVMMDGDGSMKAHEIPRFLDAIVSGADLVKGSRFLENAGSKDLTLLRRMGNLMLVDIVNLIWNTRYTDLCYGFKAFRKEILSRLNPNLRSNDFEIETEICIKSRRMNLRVEEVPSIEHERAHGRSHLNAFHDGLSIMRTIVRELLDSMPQSVRRSTRY